MPSPLIFLTVPGLREADLEEMPELSRLVTGGSKAQVKHSFPCVTWPSQCNMLTGKLPNQHGVVANGLFWREEARVEMWTAWNEVIEQPQIWDTLNSTGVSTAAWFPMLSKGSGANYVCMPAPIHQPDGSEDLWCFTKPQAFYGELLESYGHFPLQHFWGPLANIKSSQWIADSFVHAARRFGPLFSYIYLPHLDYQAQKFGPNSEQARQSLRELDQLIGNFQVGIAAAFDVNVTWMVVSEYVISEVDHVCYPNRILRQADLISLNTEDNREYLDVQNSRAWAMTDHQFSHVFVKDRDPAVIEKVASIFQAVDGIDTVLSGDERAKYSMDHPRSGDVILLSSRNSWQAYYWWEDDHRAPSFARNVDIHRKPGYDPVEMFFDMTTKSVPLDATLIKGSHGLPPASDDDLGVAVSNDPDLLRDKVIKDLDFYDLCLNHFA